MKFYRSPILFKLAVLGVAIMGIDFLRLLWGHLLVATNSDYWTRVGDTFIPMMWIIENPLMICVEIILILGALLVVIYYVVKL